MKTKYKITYTYKGDYSSEYKVIHKDDSSRYRSKTIVKNKTRDLFPEFMGKTECIIVNTGNELKVKTEHNEFILDFCEADALLTALYVGEYAGGSVLRLVKKYNDCQ